MKRISFFAIIVIYIFLATLYAVNIPKWQAPDEPAHFNYIRHIGETGTLPILQSGDYDQQYLENIKAAKFPPSLSIDAIRYESYQPPLYYLAATPVYLAARGAGVDATVIALRLFSIVLGVIVLLAAFNLIREIFPGDDMLALVVVGVMATVPQHIAVSASISNDLAAELVLILMLWLAVKRVKNEIRDWRFVIGGGVLFGAALLTKTTAYVPGAVLFVGAEIGRITIHAPRISLHSLRFTFYAFIVSAIISSPMFIRNMFTYGVIDLLGTGRHDAIVIGQPTTAEMISQFGLKHIVFDFLAITFKSFWALFGWMGVLVDDRIYVALFILCAIAALGFTFYALRIIRHRELLTEIQHWCVGLLAALLAVAIIDYIGYNFKFYQLQGRYLFPAMISIAFILVTGLRELIAREYQRIILAMLYVGFIALDVVCLFWFIVPQLQIAN